MLWQSTAHVSDGEGNLILGQLVNEVSQLVSLRGHDFSLNRTATGRWWLDFVCGRWPRSVADDSPATFATHAGARAGVTTLVIMRPPKVLDTLHGWVGFRAGQARWAIKSRWRRARGHHGAFKHGEISARAAQLTDLWERRWPGADPLGYVLRTEYADQWVRFHSLPDSKRYAENAAEYDEILRRHRTVLHDLLGSASSDALHVIAADWGWRDLSAGWSKRHLPGAWPWRSSQADEDPDAGHNYFWAASGLSPAEIDSLLLAAADDQGRFVVGAPDLEWLLCPYDGGVDVLLPSPVERDALRDRHADWLSSHPGGL